MSSARVKSARSRSSSVLRSPHEAVRMPRSSQHAPPIRDADWRPPWACTAPTPSPLMTSMHLEDVVQERLELVRELNVVNDDAVVAGFFDGAAEVWFPQTEPVAKRPSELVIADDVAGRWNGDGSVGREADLVSPGF